jgi:hypothetical protein
MEGTMRVFILDGTPDEVAALAAKLPELKVLLVGSGNLVEPREPTLMPSRWSRDNAERLLGELTGPRREFVRVLLSQPEGKASSELLQKRLHQYIKPSVSRKAAAITAFRTAITRRARRLLKDPTADPIKSWDSGGERVYQLIEPVYGLWNAMKDTR